MSFAGERRVRLERTYPAAPEAVFDAWTNPEVLRRWWRAQPSWTVPEVEVDLRVGGAYRLAMADPASGERHVLVGEYREIRRPERLVYTWCWEGNGPSAGHESLVTVEFRATGAGTTVVIDHAALLDETSRAAHAHGWNGVLDSLGRDVLDGDPRQGA